MPSPPLRMTEFLLKHQFYDTDTLEIWAIASTDPGEVILKRLNFVYDHRVQWEAGHPEIKKNVYRITLDKRELIKAQSEFFAQYDLRNVHLEIEEYIAQPI